MSSVENIKDTNIKTDSNKTNEPGPRRPRRGKKPANTAAPDNDGKNNNVNKDGKMVDPVDMMFMWNVERCQQFLDLFISIT